MIVGILAVQMVPLVAMIIPVFLLLNDLGQYDKLTGLIITYLTFILPFTVWTLRGFIVNIPKELEESAMVDGCTPHRRLRAGDLPAARPRPGRHLRLRLHPGVERVPATP